MPRLSHLSFVASSLESQSDFASSVHSYRTRQALSAVYAQASSKILPLSDPSGLSLSNDIIRKRSSRASQSLLLQISSQLGPVAASFQSVPSVKLDSLVNALPKCSNYDVLPLARAPAPNTPISSANDDIGSKKRSALQKPSEVPLPRQTNDSTRSGSSVPPTQGTVSRLNQTVFRNKLISSTGRQRPNTNYGNGRTSEPVDPPADPEPTAPPAVSGFKNASRVLVRCIAHYFRLFFALLIGLILSNFPEREIGQTGSSRFGGSGGS